MPTDRPDFVIHENSGLQFDADRIATIASHPLRGPARLGALASGLAALVVGLFLAWMPADPGARPETCGNRVGSCAEVFPQKELLPTPSQLESAVLGSLYAQILEGNTVLEDPMEPKVPLESHLGLNGWDAQRLENYTHWRNHPDPATLYPTLSKQQQAFAQSSNAQTLARQAAIQLDLVVCQMTYCDGKDPAMSAWERQRLHHTWSAYGGGPLRPLAIAAIAGFLFLLGGLAWFWRGRTSITLHAARLVWDGRSIPLPHIEQSRWDGACLWVKLRTGEVLQSTRGLRDTDGETLCRILQSRLVDEEVARSASAAQEEAEVALGRIRTAVKTRASSPR